MNSRYCTQDPLGMESKEETAMNRGWQILPRNFKGSHKHEHLTLTTERGGAFSALPTSYSCTRYMFFLENLCRCNVIYIYIHIYTYSYWYSLGKVHTPGTMAIFVMWFPTHQVVDRWAHPAASLACHFGCARLTHLKRIIMLTSLNGNASLLLL